MDVRLFNGLGGAGGVMMSFRAERRRRVVEESQIFPIEDLAVGRL